MNQSTSSVTNQRLYFAKLQLQALRELATDTSVAVQQLQFESGLLQLMLAYQSFIGELWGASAAEIALGDGLASVMADIDSLPPELRELVMLEQDSQSWLAGLLRDFQQLSKASASRTLEAVQQSEISLTMLEDADALQVLTGYCDELNAIVHRLRALTQEW